MMRPIADVIAGIGLLRPAPAPLVVQEQAERPRTIRRWRNDLGMAFVVVPPGRFRMGNTISCEKLAGRYGGKPEWFKDAQRTHDVEITKPFAIAAYAVTRGDFASFVMDSRYRTVAERAKTGWGMTRDGWQELDNLYWKDPGFDQTPDHPVVQISWDDAQAYCHWLSRRDGRKYRLPTEAQWEYACRAGSQSEFFWGDNISGARHFANFCDQAAEKWMGASFRRSFNHHVSWNDGFANTSPVGSFRPNPWGLYDMLGNVWQWCSDWYRPYGEGPQSDPTGPVDGRARALRGGSWAFHPACCRCASRLGAVTVSRIGVTGFRLALDASEIGD